MRNFVVACILISGLAAYAYAQTPAPPQANGGCKDKNWTRVLMTARNNQGEWIPDGPGRDAMFCVGGALIRADELSVVSTNGQTAYALSGNVTLTMPAR